MNEAQGQLSAVDGQTQAASARADKAREIVSQQRMNLVNTKNEIKVSQDYIGIAGETVAQLLQAKEMAQTGKASKPKELADIENKLAEVNKTIEDETVRLLEAEEAKRHAEETIEREEKELASLADEMTNKTKERTFWMKNTRRLKGFTIRLNAKKQLVI